MRIVQCRIGGCNSVRWQEQRWVSCRKWVTHGIWVIACCQISHDRKLSSDSFWLASLVRSALKTSFQWTNTCNRKATVIVSHLLIQLHVNTVRVWHCCLFQEEIKLWYLCEVFCVCVCVVHSLQSSWVKDFSRCSCSKHRQEVKNIWRHLLKTELSWVDIFIAQVNKEMISAFQASVFPFVLTCQSF